MADQHSILLQRSSLGANSPATTPATATAALPVNTLRCGFRIQNASTGILYILFGTGTASSSNYNVALSACTAANDGLGGSFTQSTGVVWTGAVTIGGATPSYAIVEF